MERYRVGRKLTFILLLLVLLFSCACTKKFSIEDCFSCVYSIVCSDESRYDSVGSAFIIKDNKIITNAHVVSYLDDGEYVVFSNIIAKAYGTDEEIPLAVEKISYKDDVAILKYVNEDDKINKYLNTSNSTSLKIGEKLSTIGNLNNYGLCYNSGNLSSYKKKILNNGEYNIYFQTNIEISKGSSGGPVVNKENQVVGVMTFKVRDTNSEYVDGMSFFIPIETVMEIMMND